MIARHATGAHCAVEIGVYEGVTTLVIAASMAPDGILYGVDPFLRGSLGISYGKVITERALRREHLSHKVQLIEKFSYDAAPFVTAPLDFAFIDGDHHYEAIERDWSDWSVKIKLGGLIALHDTQTPAHDLGVAGYGSVRYFRETIARDPRFQVVDSADSLNVLRRVT